MRTPIRPHTQWTVSHSKIPVSAPPHLTSSRTANRSEPPQSVPIRKQNKRKRFMLEPRRRSGHSRRRKFIPLPEPGEVLSKAHDAWKLLQLRYPFPLQPNVMVCCVCAHPDDIGTHQQFLVFCPGPCRLAFHPHCINGTQPPTFTGNEGAFTSVKAAVDFRCSVECTPCNSYGDCKARCIGQFMTEEQVLNVIVFWRRRRVSLLPTFHNPAEDTKPIDSLRRAHLTVDNDSMVDIPSTADTESSHTPSSTVSKTDRSQLNIDTCLSTSFRCRNLKNRPMICGVCELSHSLDSNPLKACAGPCNIMYHARCVKASEREHFRIKWYCSDTCALNFRRGIHIADAGYASAILYNHRIYYKEQLTGTTPLELHRQKVKKMFESIDKHYFCPSDVYKVLESRLLDPVQLPTEISLAILKFVSDTAAFDSIFEISSADSANLSEFERASGLSNPPYPSNPVKDTHDGLSAPEISTLQSLNHSVAEQSDPNSHSDNRHGLGADQQFDFDTVAALSTVECCSLDLEMKRLMHAYTAQVMSNNYLRRAVLDAIGTPDAPISISKFDICKEHQSTIRQYSQHIHDICKDGNRPASINILDCSSLRIIGCNCLNCWLNLNSYAEEMSTSITNSHDETPVPGEVDDDIYIIDKNESPSQEFYEWVRDYVTTIQVVQDELHDLDFLLKFRDQIIANFGEEINQLGNTSRSSNTLKRQSATWGNTVRSPSSPYSTSGKAKHQRGNLLKEINNLKPWSWDSSVKLEKKDHCDELTFDNRPRRLRNLKYKPNEIIFPEIISSSSLFRQPPVYSRPSVAASVVIPLTSSSVPLTEVSSPTVIHSQRSSFVKTSNRPQKSPAKPSSTPIRSNGSSVSPSSSTPTNSPQTTLPIKQPDNEGTDVLCIACGEDGSVIMCDEYIAGRPCPRVYHRSCLNRLKIPVPADQFICPFHRCRGCEKDNSNNAYCILCNYGWCKECALREILLQWTFREPTVDARFVICSPCYKFYKDEYKTDLMTLEAQKELAAEKKGFLINKSPATHAEVAESHSKGQVEELPYPTHDVPVSPISKSQPPSPTCTKIEQPTTTCTEDPPEQTSPISTADSSDEEAPESTEETEAIPQESTAATSLLPTAEEGSPAEAEDVYVPESARTRLSYAEQLENVFGPQRLTKAFVRRFIKPSDLRTRSSQHSPALVKIASDTSKTPIKREIIDVDSMNDEDVNGSMQRSRDSRMVVTIDDDQEPEEVIELIDSDDESWNSSRRKRQKHSAVVKMDPDSVVSRLRSTTSRIAKQLQSTIIID